MFAERFLAALLFACLMAGARAENLIGENCRLEMPPLDAGYSALLGMPLRVYPSHEVVSAQYSGCQVIWVTDAGVDKLEMKIRFESGKPKQLVAGRMNLTFGNCTGDSIDRESAALCETAATFPYRSYAKECLKIRTEPADSAGTFIDRKCMQSPDHVRDGSGGAGSGER